MIFGKNAAKRPKTAEEIKKVKRTVFLPIIVFAKGAKEPVFKMFRSSAKRKEAMGKILKSVSEIADRDQREVVIPDEYSVIGPRAFRGCASIQRVVIPGTVTEIADGAFAGCKALASVEMYPTITEIGAFAFKGCGALVSFEIPGSVTVIGSGAFDGCTSLESVSVPESAQWEKYTFWNCPKLTITRRRPRK